MASSSSGVTALLRSSVDVFLKMSEKMCCYSGKILSITPIILRFWLAYVVYQVSAMVA